MKKRIILFLFFISCLIVGINVYIEYYMPNYNVEPFYKYMPKWNSGEISILLEDEPIDNLTAPIEKDGVIFLPVDFITEYIDEFIYWESHSDTLILTTPDKVYKFKANEKEYTINNSSDFLKTPFISQNNVAYIPEDFIELFYNVDINYAEENNILIVDYKDRKHVAANVITRRSYIRYAPDIKSPVAKKVEKDDLVYIYGQSNDNKWTTVRSSCGLLGYILSKDISDFNDIEPVVIQEAIISPMWAAESGKINLVWDQVFKQDETNSEEKRERHIGLDVLSPTWLSIISGDGEIKCIASKEYVDWAHTNGIKVWALIDNSFNADLTHEFLSTIKRREYIISQIIELAEQFNFDGINFDFEEFSKDDGENFVQFIREAGPLLREEGLVVSVDVNVPKPWTAHFRRDVISKSIDYLIVMAYDEHWSSSPESGPVASIGWVKEGIENTLKEVPQEKILVGLPYYNRIWTENAGKVSSRSYGMQRAFNIFSENNADISWLEDVALYYGEYVGDDGATYKAWLENEKSLEEKVKLVFDYELAGVAGWKRGLEKSEVWGMLAEKLGK